MSYELDDEAMEIAREIFTQDELEDILYIEEQAGVDIDLDDILADDIDYDL